MSEYPPATTSLGGAEPPANQYFQPVQHQMYNTLRGLGPLSGHHSSPPRLPDAAGGSGGGSFDPFLEPEFLTKDQRLEVVLGDTVVLPCELNHIGKIYDRNCR